jgi:hypothetical protein
MSALIIDDKTKIIYLDKLVGNIFKILPLYEEVDSNVYKIYIGGLLIDINSANSLFDGILIDLIIKINTLFENNFEHKQMRKIVLECTNLVKKIRRELENNGQIT